MRVSIFGLGYVGCATAAGLAGGGHEILGVDISERKVRMIDRGESPIAENDLDAVIRACARRGRLQGCADGTRAVGESDVSLISVGSPRKRNGRLDHGPLLHAIWEIGEGLKEKRDYHVIGLRSAISPGTTEALVIPELEKISGKSAGKDFAVCVNPEFLRKGSGWEELIHPPFVLVGGSAGRSRVVWQQLYQSAGQILHTEIRTAEMLKCTCDAWNALHGAGETAKHFHDLDGATRELIDLVCQETGLDRLAVNLRENRASGSPAAPSHGGAPGKHARPSNLEAPLLRMVLECLEAQRRGSAGRAATSSVSAIAGDDRGVRARSKLSTDC